MKKNEKAKPVFPLSAGELARQAMAIPSAEKKQFGVYYANRLRFECALLLPRSVSEREQLAAVIRTWETNRGFFVCSSIGEALERYKKYLKEA